MPSLFLQMPCTLFICIYLVGTHSSWDTGDYSIFTCTSDYVGHTQVPQERFWYLKYIGNKKL